MILDTSVFIEAERERFDLEGLLEAAGDEPVAIAAVTAAELLHGVERATNARIRVQRHQYVERIIGNFPIIPFDLAVARVHARTWTALAQRGTMIGPHDLIVAATALANDTSVATLNGKEFTRIPELLLVVVTRFVRPKRR